MGFDGRRRAAIYGSLMTPRRHTRTATFRTGYARKSAFQLTEIATRLRNLSRGKLGAIGVASQVQALSMNKRPILTLNLKESSSIFGWMSIHSRFAFRMDLLELVKEAGASKSNLFVYSGDFCQAHSPAFSEA